MTIKFRPVEEKRVMRQLNLQDVLTHISDYTNDAIVITDASPVDGPGPRIVFVNATFTRITGFSAEEAIGQRPSFLYGEKTSLQVIQSINDALSSCEAVVAELINYKKSGGSFWAELSIVPVSDEAGECKFWILIYRQTTELRLQNRKLELQSLAMEATSDAIVICEVDETSTRAIYGNRPYAKLFANGSGPVDFDFLQLFPVNRRVEILESLRESCDVRGARTFEEPLAPPGRSPFEGRVLVEPVSSDVVGPRALLVRIIDITTEIQRRKEIAHTQRLQAIGQLTGGVAHDFNNLLMIVTSCVELASLDPTLSEDTRGLLETIGDAANLGASLTSQLLSFGRCSSLVAQDVAVEPFLERFLCLLRRTLPATIFVRLNVEPAANMLRADPSQLQAALLNLAINARDAMNFSGSISLNASARTLSEADAEGLELRAGDYVELSVIDDGPGMPQEVLTRAFEPFFTRKDVGQGSGLGLSMVYGFCRQSGGNARIVSGLGRGTRVELLLPVPSAPAVALRVSPKEPAAVDFSALRVLVVEDDAVVRAQVSRLLRRIGCRTLLAANAQEARGLLEADPEIDVMFTDIVMPGGVSGVTLARQAVRIAPALKILFTSGYSTEDPAGFVDLRSGAPLLRKPYRRSQLVAAIAALFQGAAEAA